MDRARDEHLAGLGDSGDPGTDVDGDAAQLVVDTLRFAGVHVGDGTLDPQQVGRTGAHRDVRYVARGDAVDLAAPFVLASRYAAAYHPDR
jgi:hypothetical protein